MNPEMSYACTDDERAVAGCIARRRNSLNGGQTNLPHGETADEKERLKQHYQACLAEIAVSRLFNLAWTGCGKGSSGCRDVGDYIEVRSIEEGTSKGLLVRPKDVEAPYVLTAVTVASGKVRTLGWAWLRDIKELGKVLDKETEKPCWILEAGRLKHSDALKTIVKDWLYETVVKPEVMMEPIMATDIRW